MHPTESLPEVVSPPRPTFRPTSSMKIPQIPIVFKPSTDIDVPNMPLTFQIKQGANGWSDYPDSPSILTDEISKIAGIDKKYITGIQATQTYKRNLLSIIYFYYNITTPPISTNKNYVESIYKAIVYKLTESTNDGTFSEDLWKLGYKINVTSIIVLQYYQPPQTTNSLENKPTGEATTSFYVYISILSIIAASLICTAMYCVCKKRLDKKKEIVAKIRDSIPNPLIAES